MNLLAAAEIARQLRLRDMGGIIVVDFIDMGRAENRKKLFEFLRDEMKEDRAKHKILPPSKFGLIQITRQRVRPEMNIKTSEVNPNSQGQVEAPIVLIDKINAEVERIASGKANDVFLNIHPFIAAYLTKGFLFWPKSIRLQWFLKYKKWIRIQPRDAYTYLQYRFKNKKGRTIKT